VLLTSDNGSTFDLGGYDPEFFDGTGGHRGFKTNLYEGGIRVPLIATWPGHIEAGSSDDTVVANWDFFPTVMKLTGASTTATLDGIDFSQVLLGEGDAPKREALYWEYHSRGGMQAVRMGKWKALRMKAHGHPDAPIELYDLEHDPAELTDVASDNPAVVKRIETIMHESRVPSDVRSWNFAPDERAKEIDATELRFESGGETRQFLLHTHAVILRTGSLTLTGGGNPVNGSTVDLIGGSARLIFSAESPEDVRKEHLRKFKVNGAKAVEGRNIVIEQDAEGRTIVRAWQRSDA
jgi:hypothetical protein